MGSTRGGEGKGWRCNTIVNQADSVIETMLEVSTVAVHVTWKAPIKNDETMAFANVEDRRAV
jgi:hypothetical protein